MVLLSPTDALLQVEAAAEVLKVQNERFVQARFEGSDLKPILVLQGEVAHCDLTREPGLVLGSVYATTCCK